MRYIATFMRFIAPSIGLLCFLWSMIATALKSRSLRNWQLKAEALMGLSGMSFCGLILYLRLFPQINAHNLEKGLLAGMTFGVFVTLWLEGSWNLLKKPGSRETAGGKGDAFSDK